MHVCPSIHLYSHPYIRTEGGRGEGVGRKGNPDMATWVCSCESQTSLEEPSLLFCSSKNLKVIWFKQGTYFACNTLSPCKSSAFNIIWILSFFLCRQFLMPGFVDTHIHAPQYVFTGTGYDLPLLQWLEKYTFPSESRFRKVEFAQVAYRKVVVSEYYPYYWSQKKLKSKLDKNS